MVRRIAHCLYEVGNLKGSPDLADPGLTGSHVVDALVAAAAESTGSPAGGANLAFVDV